MAARAEITGQDVYDQIAMYIESGRDEEALDYWRTTGMAYAKRLTDEQYFAIMDFLSSAGLSARLQMEHKTTAHMR